MIRAISDLSEEELNLLFDVEYEILPVLHSVGIMLDEEKIRLEILKNPQQSIVLLQDNNFFIGLLRFDYQGEDLFVTSLNIRRKTRTFLKHIYKLFKDLKFRKIKSTVQLTNKPSFSFHQKLGFKEVSRSEQAARFEIDREDFLKRLLYFT